MWIFNDVSHCAFLIQTKPKKKIKRFIVRNKYMCLSLRFHLCKGVSYIGRLLRYDVPVATWCSFVAVNTYM